MAGLSGGVWLLLGFMAALVVAATIIMIMAARADTDSTVRFTEAPPEILPEEPGWYADSKTGKTRWWDGRKWEE